MNLPPSLSESHITPTYKMSHVFFFHLFPQQPFEYFKFHLVDGDLNPAGWRGLSPRITPLDVAEPEFKLSTLVSCQNLQAFWNIPLPHTAVMIPASLRTLFGSTLWNVQRLFKTIGWITPYFLFLLSWKSLPFRMLCPIKKTLISFSRGVI